VVVNEDDPVAHLSHLFLNAGRRSTMKRLLWISGLALALVMCAVFMLTRPTKAQVVHCSNSCTSARAFADNYCQTFAYDCHISSWGCGTDANGYGSYSWGCACYHNGTGGNGSIDPSCNP
jgi:hypothetical protein